MGYNLLWPDSLVKVVYSARLAVCIHVSPPWLPTTTRVSPQLKAVKARFGVEFDPSSLAANYGNHCCFLFLR